MISEIFLLLQCAVAGSAHCMKQTLWSSADHVPTFFGMCCRSEWQERMYIYKWHEVDQTKHEIFCVHIVCNEIQVKVNLEITTFFFYLRFPYCPNFFWFGVVLKTWLFKQNTFKCGVSCRAFWEYQFTVFDCKLYIDLLFFTSKNCTINSILL